MPAHFVRRLLDFGTPNEITRPPSRVRSTRWIESLDDRIDESSGGRSHALVHDSLLQSGLRAGRPLPLHTRLGGRMKRPKRSIASRSTHTALPAIVRRTTIRAPTPKGDYDSWTT